MQETENKELTSAKDKLMERLKAKFPDRNFEPKNEQEGQNGQEGQEIEPSDMYESLLEFLDEYEKKNGEYEQYNQKLTDLFKTNPYVAELFTEWAKEGDPTVAMTKLFGLEAVQEAFNSEEGKEKIATANKEWLERKANDDQASEERAENFDKTIETLEIWGKEKGLDEEGMKEIFIRLLTVGDNALRGIFTEDDFRMAYNDMHYDKDVAKAKEEGEVIGKNIKIKETLLTKKNPTDMPSSFSGQPTIHEEKEKPKKSTEGDLWGL